MLNSCKTAAAALATAAILSTQAMAPARADVPESNDPIVIALNNWTSQLVQSYVAGQLLERMGYTVEYIPADSQLLFIAMGEGDITFTMEVWEAGQAKSFQVALDAGGVVDAGNHDTLTREDMWYPSYIEEVCPGLPDWKALNSCAALFASAETSPKGRFVGPPADWVKHFQERMDALGMNFQEVAVGQAATLWAELQAAYDRKEAIVLFNWTPNFIEAKFEGRFVEFPDYEPACHTDPAWGPNPNALYDCGSPKDGWLKKAAWVGMADKWPAAFAFLQRTNFNNAQIATLAALVDIEGLTPEEAATRWIEENEAVWRNWIPES